MVDLKMEEQLKGFQKRNLAQPYVYRVASRTFGPARTRNRVFTAEPVQTLNSLQLSSKQVTNGQKRSVPVVAPGIRDRDHWPSPTTMLPGNVDVANHRDCVEQRMAFRKELDKIGNLPKLFPSEPTVKEIEKLVVEREKKPTAPPKGDMHDEERLAISKLPCQNSSREDDHSQPSTLGGSTGLTIDCLRRQILGEYRNTLDQCSKKGVAISQSTLEKGLLYPRERDRGSLILKQKKIEEQEEEALPKLIPAYPSRRSVHQKPKMMNLSTGRAKVGHKTECWMTSEDYKDLSGTVTMMPSDQRANQKAFRPGKEDRVRLYLPQVCYPLEGMFFQHNVRSPAPSRGNRPF